MEHTTHYALPQWEASDPIRRGDFNSAMGVIDTALAEQRAAINTKADQTDLNVTNATLAGKAEQSALNATNDTVATKADKSALEETNAAVAAKADKSALEKTNAALAGKAEQSALNATNSDLAALTTAVGAGGYNCRIEYGSFTSPGVTTLSFDFRPALVVVSMPSSTTSPLVLIRGQTQTIAGSAGCGVNWTEGDVTWAGSPQYNTEGAEYCYVAVGR